MEAAVLKRGMLVRLLGHVGEDGEFKNPIEKFEVFVPEQPTSNSNSNPAYRNNNVPGIYALKDYRPPVPADRATDEVRIIGHFLELKNETLSLQCGNIVKKIAVKEETSIELNIRTLEYAQPGDTVTGTATTAAGTNQLIASNVSVFAAKPLAPPPAAPAKGPSVPKLRVKEKSK